MMKPNINSEVTPMLCPSSILALVLTHSYISLITIREVGMPFSKQFQSTYVSFHRMLSLG